VADASLRRDRNLKLPAYGRAGIVETWVVDINGGVVLVGTQPATEGYALVTVHRRGDGLVVPQFPAVTLPVEDILGPIHAG
jgi:Uma2 family endonuclease